MFYNMQTGLYEAVKYDYFYRSESKMYRMINNQSKYKLVVDYVVDRIRDGRYKKGDRVPSINEFKEIFQLSRDTVFTGIRVLKSKGIITSYPGVGYYITTTRIAFKHHIFLLFNEFNEFKEDLYNSFCQSIGNSATVDLYFHNYNRHVFERLLHDANNKYTVYVIMSGKFAGIAPLLESLRGEVLLLDHFHPELKGKYSSVAQNFEKDTYEALVSGIDNLRKYRHIVMVQKEAKEPTERYDGVCTFCREFGFTSEYVGTTEGRSIERGEVYMVVNDRDLVRLLKQAEVQSLTLGSDFGIISFNDTPLKEVLAGGITTLSTDFKLMGRTMAGLIGKRTVETIENPSYLNIRKSL